MGDTPSTIPITKRQAVRLALIPVLLMLGISLRLLLQDGPDLERLFDAGGSRDRLPSTTLIILSTYRFWIAAPLAALAAVLDFVRRPAPGAKHLVMLLAACYAGALVMTWGVVEGLYGVLIRLNLMTMTR